MLTDKSSLNDFNTIKKKFAFIFQKLKKNRLLSHAFISLACTLLTTNFLWLFFGPWKYLDTGWFPQTTNEAHANLIHQFSAWNALKTFGFGAETMLLQSTRWFIDIPINVSIYIFGDTTQSIFYIILFQVGWFAWYKILKLLNTNNYLIYSLVLTFNPITLYLISQYTIFASFMLTPYLLLGTIKWYLQKKLHFSSAFYIIIGCVGSMIYLRTGLIFLVLIFLFLMIYIKKVLQFANTNRGDVFFLTGCILLAFIPFLFSLFNTTTNPTNLLSNLPFSPQHMQDLLTFQEDIPLFATNEILTAVIRSVSNVLILACIIVVIYERKTRPLSIIFFLLLFSTIAFNFAPINLQSLLLIFAPFLGITIYYWKALILYVGILLLATSEFGRKKLVLAILVIVSALGIIPALFINSNKLLEKCNNSCSIVAKEQGSFKTLFLPNRTDQYIGLSGAPYPTIFAQNPTYIQAFSNNTRIVEDVKIISDWKKQLQRAEELGIERIIHFTNVTSEKDYGYRVPLYTQNEYDLIQEQAEIERELSQLPLEIVDRQNNYVIYKFIYSRFSPDISWLDNNLQNNTQVKYISQKDKNIYYINFTSRVTGRLYLNQTYSPKWKLAHVISQNNQHYCKVIEVYQSSNSAKCMESIFNSKIEKVETAVQKDEYNRAYFEIENFDSGWYKIYYDSDTSYFLSYFGPVVALPAVFFLRYFKLKLYKSRKQAAKKSNTR